MLQACRRRPSRPRSEPATGGAIPAPPSGDPLLHARPLGKPLLEAVCKRDPNYGATPLHFAVWGGDADLAHTLIDGKANHAADTPAPTDIAQELTDNVEIIIAATTCWQMRAWPKQTLGQTRLPLRR